MVTSPPPPPPVTFPLAFFFSYPWEFAGFSYILLCASTVPVEKIVQNTTQWPGENLNLVLFLRGHPRKQLDHLVTRLLLIKFAHLKVVDLNFNFFLISWFELTFLSWLSFFRHNQLLCLLLSRSRDKWPGIGPYTLDVAIHRTDTTIYGYSVGRGFFWTDNSGVVFTCYSQ